MGYHPEALCPSNLKQALHQVPDLKNIEVEVRNKMVQVSKNRPSSKSHAPTIWCKWEDTGKCRTALAKIYSRNNNGAYPLATQARFIPNTVDSRFITSVSARAMAIKAQDKHEAFLAKTATGIGHSIVGLDYFLDEYQVNLCKVIMSICSAKEPDSNLFVAVDDMNLSSICVPPKLS